MSTAPWWVWSIVEGVPFGILTGAFAAHHGLLRAVSQGLIGGVFFGALMGPFVSGRRRRYQLATTGLPRSDARAAHRSVMRGSVPADPEIRRAAIALAKLQLRDWTRLKLAYFVVFGLADAVAIYLVITSHGVVLAILFFTVLLATPPWMSRRTKRRLKLLESGT